MNRKPFTKDASARSPFRAKNSRHDTGTTNLVVIDPDVSEYFPDRESVNEALRGLIAIIRRQRETAEVESKRQI